MSLTEFFDKQVKVINVGISSFAQDLKSQGTAVIQVDWQPPAGGNKKIQALLARVEKWQNEVKAN